MTTINYYCAGTGKRCLGSDLKSFNNLWLLDISLQLPLQGRCQGDDHHDYYHDLLANKCLKVIFWENSFNSDHGAGGSGPPPPTWSRCARSSSSQRCTSTSPTLRTAATMVLVPGLARAGTLLTATSPQTYSGQTTQFCHQDFP